MHRHLSSPSNPRCATVVRECCSLLQHCPTIKHRDVDFCDGYSWLSRCISFCKDLLGCSYHGKISPLIFFSSWRTVHTSDQAHNHSHKARVCGPGLGSCYQTAPRNHKALRGICAIAPGTVSTTLEGTRAITLLYTITVLRRRLVGPVDYRDQREYHRPLRERRGSSDTGRPVRQVT